VCGRVGVDKAAHAVMLAFPLASDANKSSKEARQGARTHIHTHTHAHTHKHTHTEKYTHTHTHTLTTNTCALGTCIRAKSTI